MLNEMWLTNRQVQPRNLRCPRSKFQRAPLKVICFVVRTWEHADQFFLWKLFDWMIWGLDLWIKWVVSDVDLALGHVDSLSQKGDVALVIHLQEKQCIDSQDKTKTPITKTIFFDSWQFAVFAVDNCTKKYNYKDKNVASVIHLEEKEGNVSQDKTWTTTTKTIAQLRRQKHCLCNQ